MWPVHIRERIRQPMDDHQTMFSSQMPYVPLGDRAGGVLSGRMLPGIPGRRPEQTLTRVSCPI